MEICGKREMELLEKIGFTLSLIHIWEERTVSLPQGYATLEGEPASQARLAAYDSQVYQRKMDKNRA